MKLSFSLPSKSSSKTTSNHLQTFAGEDQVNPTSSIKKDYVTNFDSSKALTDSHQKRPIITPLPNGWRPEKKMKNLSLPFMESIEDGLLHQFEVEGNSGSVDPSDNNTSYGLNLRHSKKSVANQAVELNTQSVDSLLQKKIRDDLKSAPDNNDLDDYSEVPVESFAAAVLAGYGWSEGKGIGRNTKEDVKVVEYKQRGRGVGFMSAPNMSQNVHNENNGIEREVKRSREVEENKAKERGRFYAGKDVRIIGGNEIGVKGKILEVVSGGDAVILRLSRSKQEVRVKIHDIADEGSVEEERCLRELKELKQEKRRGRDGEKGERVDLSGGQNIKEHREEKSKFRMKENKGHKEEGISHRKEKSRRSEVSWLTSHIRVRIISKELGGGKLYLKKGKVVDVVGPMTCDISMDESRELIQGVNQEFLETAVPRCGGPVLILYGRHKGVYGSLMERNVENETGVVRDADSHELVHVRLEQIAEYTGDPSYLGY